MEVRKLLWSTDFSGNAEKVVKNSPVPVVMVPIRNRLYGL